MTGVNPVDEGAAVRLPQSAGDQLQLTDLCVDDSIRLTRVDVQFRVARLRQKACVHQLSHVPKTSTKFIYTHTHTHTQSHTRTLVRRPQNK